PSDNFRWLVERQSPPPGARVWFGAIDAGGKHATWHQAGSLFGADGQELAFLTTFSVGCALFQVFGHDIYGTDGLPLRDLPTLAPPEPLSAALLDLWPGPAMDVVWPPRYHVAWDQRGEVAAWPRALGLAQLPTPQQASGAEAPATR
ncbi:MAG TPA: hypothetical protein VME46_07775, partial [Acidimicrobiales bacterium]|nr:hypothetical protein [Acidimicrobiales bacterium]